MGTTICGCSHGCQRPLEGDLYSATALVVGEQRTLCGWCVAIHVPQAPNGVAQTLVTLPIPLGHEAGTCLPLCADCTAILRALNAPGHLWQQSDDPDVGLLEICGGQWLPASANHQECGRCSQMRPMPDDPDAKGALYHLEPYEGVVVDPRQPQEVAL